MELLKKVILSACFLSIVISLADSIKPGESFARQLKLIFSLLFISGIVVSAANCEFELDIPASAGTEELEGYESISEAADKVVLSAAEESVIDMTGRILTSQGISYEKISADINMNEDGSISINEIGYCGSEFEKASAAIKSNIADTEVKQIE